MKPVVLDASTVLGLLLQDERTAYTLRVMSVVEKNPPLFVPSHWWLETLNGALMAERRGRISHLELLEIVRDLSQMPVATDEETSQRGPGETLSLARQFALTIYDAAYLELAMRRNAKLATSDKALARAAALAGVDVLK